MRVDAVYTLAQLERFDPGAYVAELALPPATTLAELATRDTAALTELAAIDAMIARAMKLRLELVDALAPPTRIVFATTIVQFARQLDVLQQRVYSVAPAAVPAVLVVVVVLLDLRARLQDGATQ